MFLEQWVKNIVFSIDSLLMFPHIANNNMLRSKQIFTALKEYIEKLNLTTQIIMTKTILCKMHITYKFIFFLMLRYTFAFCTT